MAITMPTRVSRLSPLSLAEKLLTPHGVDRYLELVNPMLTVRELRGEITNVHRSTTDTVTLTIRPTRQWQGFEAGQFVKIGVVIDGVRHTRCYSPADSQYRSGQIELTIKAHPEGLVSNYLHANARPGLVVALSQADGMFKLPAQRPDKVVLISGGSGITPVLSMLRTLIAEGYAGDITFLHYAYTEADVPYLAELRRLAVLNDNLSLVLAYTDADNGDLRGFFGPEHLVDAAPFYAEAQTFLCGPPGLMRSVRELYREYGLEDSLHTEEFAPAITVVAGEAEGELSFSDGTAIRNDGRPLLELAEAAGKNPLYGCRMGICNTCVCVKKTGATRNLLTGELSTDPDEEIRICISVPVGDVALDL